MDDIDDIDDRDDDDDDVNEEEKDERVLASSRGGPKRNPDGGSCLGTCG